MKIALLTDGVFPYVIGGMQRHSYYLVKYLAKNKIYVDLYHFNQSGYDISKLEFFSDDEKKYIRSFVIDFPKLGNLPGHYIRESYEYSCRVFQALSKNEGYDFIYAKGFSGWNLIERKMKGYKSAPVGVNFHGYEMFQPAPTFRSKLEQLFFLQKPALFNIQNADHVFSYGSKITDIVLGLGIRKNKIIEVPAGIEEHWLTDRIKEVDAKRRFLFVGRYERRKGVEELNRILETVINDSNLEFYFVGNIPENKKIASPKVKYFDSISDTEKLKSIYRECDVLVCPSHSEGMPNVIVEAMSSGLAVIATDVGAVNLLVNSQNGWLIPANSPMQLEQKIREATLLDAKSMMKMKSSSFESIKGNFLWDSISQTLIDQLKGFIRHTD